MATHSRKQIALRRTRGHASTASFAHLEGQKHLTPVQQRRLDRMREGKCPECGNLLDDATREGRTIVNGRVVKKCVDCRLQHQIWAEERKKRANGETTETAPPQSDGDGMARTTLLGERLQQADELHVAKRLFDSKPESVILIVGGRTTNIQRNAREHKRVVMWESTHLRDRKMPIMPTNVAVVMCTRFCSHQVSNDLRIQAQQRKAFQFSGLLESGEMRRNLATLLNLDASKVNEGADDFGDSVAVKPSPPLQPLPPLPKPKPTVVTTPSRVLPAPAQEQEQMPTETPKPVVFPQDADLDRKIDDAIDMVSEAIAALQQVRVQIDSKVNEATVALSLVNDQLATTRTAIKASAEGLKKLKMLKEILGGL